MLWYFNDLKILGVNQYTCPSQNFYPGAAPVVPVGLTPMII